MSQDKRWLTNDWNDDLKHFEDSDSGLRHAKASNPANPAMPDNPVLVDEMDEQAARLLLAIETMCTELRAGRANEALITGIMALSEHRARLVSHTPAHLSALWESEKDTGE